MQKIRMIGLAAIACAAAFAQREGTFVSADGGATKVHFENQAFRMATGPTVTGAPYSAQGVTETNQTLGDGTHINRQETYTIYRDGEGRMRRESGDHVWISDPVANVSYILDTKLQTARKLGLSKDIAYKKMQLDQQQAAKLKAEGAATGPIWFSSGAAERGMVLGAVRTDGPMAGGGKTQGAPPKIESLGKQEMEGVEVEGSRTTMEIPQGQIGNDRALQVVDERWESPELHVTILAKHTDPMVGEHVERLTNVQRGEPDPSLFQVPAGFKMESDQ